MTRVCAYTEHARRNRAAGVVFCLCKLVCTELFCN
jgi:hypothetical protein